MDIEKAKENLKYFCNYEILYGGKICFTIGQLKGYQKAIEVLLNELDKDNNIISDLQNEVTLKQCELDNKDKIINEMAEVLNDFDYDKQCEICHTDICSASVDRTEYIKCIIDYFTKKVSEK